MTDEKKCKSETKETSTQFNEKISVIQPNPKVITLLQNLNLNLHLPIRLDYKQNLHRKPVHKHSQIQQVDYKHDPSPEQLIQKKKNRKEKQKDKEKGPNPYSKGALADPIKVVNLFDSFENMVKD